MHGIERSLKFTGPRVVPAMRAAAFH